MSLTKAELDAALSEMERKMERKMDIKFGARISDVQARIDKEEAKDEKKREVVQEEISESVTTDISSLSKKIDDMAERCRRNEREIEGLKRQFVDLEIAFDRFRSQYAVEEMEDHDITGEY